MVIQRHWLLTENARHANTRAIEIGKRLLYRRGIVLALLAGCFWSTGGILIRQIEAASNWQIIFYRSVTLTLTLLCFLAVRHRSCIAHELAGAGATVVVAGLSLAASFVCFIYSITHTTVANTLFLLAASPFFAAIIAWVVLREQVRRATWFAMTAALVGITVMVADGLAVGTLFGNLMGLLAALGLAAFAVALRWGRQVNMVPAVCLGGAFAAIASALMAESFIISLHDLRLCIVMGVVQIGLGLILFTVGSRHVPAAELTLLTLTEVILGPIWVWLGVGEVPTLYTLAGGAIVLGAIAGYALTGMRRPPSGTGVAYPRTL